MSNNNGVILTVHVESRTLQSDRWTNGPIKRINPNKVSLKNRIFKTQGYDRRAQLLAYAHKLRHANAKQLPLPTFKNSKPKHNKWRWGVAMEKIGRLITRFDGMKAKCRYEPIVAVAEDYCDNEGSCKQETRMNKGRKGSTRRRYPHFCNKLRCLMKKISRAWKCKIGSFGKGD